MKQCKHKWKIITEKILESPKEQIGSFGSDWTINYDNSFFRKKYILVLQCKRCGKLEKIITTNP